MMSIERRPSDVVTLLIKQRCNEEVKTMILYCWWNGLQLSRQKSVATFDKNNIVIKTSEQRRCIVDKMTL